MTSNTYWSSEIILKLIDLYKTHPILWDPRHKDYKNRDARNIGMQEISDILGVDRYEVERKLKIILTQFRREFAKVASRGEECGTSRWFAYNSLQFLVERQKYFLQANIKKAGTLPGGMHSAHWNEETESRDEISPTQPVEVEIKEEMYGDNTIDGIDLDFLPAEEYPETEQQQNKQTTHQTFNNMSRKRHLPEYSIEGGSYTSSNNINQKPSISCDTCNVRTQCIVTHANRDEYDIFGEHIACKLRKLSNKYAKAVAQHMISVVLFEADIGKYDKPGYCSKVIRMEAEELRATESNEADKN